MKALSLCSGIGAFDLAMQAIGVQTVAYCEIDKWCRSVLLRRMEDGYLDSAPIWDDLITLAGDDLPDEIGLVYGGIPCQPHSNAGNRLGAEDPRDLWPATRRLLGEIRPRLFVLENVAGFATRNGGTPAFAYSVLADLAELGYVGSAGIVKASDTGAPHSRARWFCVAYAGHDGSAEQEQQQGQRAEVFERGGHSDVANAGRIGVPGRRGRGADASSAGEGQGGMEQRRIRPASHDSHADVGDAERSGYDGRAQNQERGQEQRAAAARAGDELGDAAGQGLQGGAWGGFQPGVFAARCFPLGDSQGARREERGWRSGEESAFARLGQRGQFPPHRLDAEGWAAVVGARPDLAPALEPGLRRVVDGAPYILDADRRKRLAALGNAVVPAQVLTALEVLL